MQVDERVRRPHAIEGDDEQPEPLPYPYGKKSKHREHGGGAAIARVRGYGNVVIRRFEQPAITRADAALRLRTVLGDDGAQATRVWSSRQRAPGHASTQGNIRAVTPLALGGERVGPRLIDREREVAGSIETQEVCQRQRLDLVRRHVADVVDGGGGDA